MIGDKRDNDIFIIPILDRYLIYAPKFRYVRIIHQHELEQISHYSEFNIPDNVKEKIITDLSEINRIDLEQIPSGNISSPVFLGLITTYLCSMGCKYCSFSTGDYSNPFMSINLAKVAIDEYLSIIHGEGNKIGEIQFFGGEPFYNNRVVEFTVGYARNTASANNIDLRFEVTTNGAFSQRRCQWIAENLDAVVLSLDGTAKIQNNYRPFRGGEDSFDTVFRSAKILSEGSCDLIIRVCVTNDTVADLPEIATWIKNELVVNTVCLEPITHSQLSVKNNLLSPDPYIFAKYFLETEDILSNHGIKTTTSGTDIDKFQRSYCPVGKDAIIVTPDGEINACYLHKELWNNDEGNLNFGYIQERPPKLIVNQYNLNQIRAINGTKYEKCKECFCKYHCAGGCHVNHKFIHRSHEMENICVHTRLITIGKLLKRINAIELYRNWINSPEMKLSLSSSRIEPL